MKVNHYCPEWDFDWIIVGSPEMGLCICSFDREGEMV